MAGKDVLLSVDGVKATYNGAITALHGVSFTLRRGEILALLGANGAGKTTTLKAISNLLPAERGEITAGSILYQGRDVTKTKPAELVRAGLVQVLEGRHCFRNLTVEENLIAGGLGRSGSRAEIAADLERVYAIFPRLKDKRRAVSGLASGGEQQMVAIGRALMSRPTLLVLDEPSMGLAPIIVQDIFRTLRRLNAESGLSILVAEQNSAIALRYADRATVLENGAAALSGDAAELRQRDDVKAFYLGQKAASLPVSSTSLPPA
ncbi:ABC transporter ATP-binding protein [Rhizobium leguminosarum]|uniref:ABC-type branched-chain amino acid transport system, ATPase component n=1 Tax=Rhizobium leguminosarum bv. trifolii WSM597 TaxID=754764 RepID=I9XBS6_RHILT|nr:ABC transporter ATP-binding protein [Rhizobium leguminosarum]EJB06471.1 ABC-type branched-chain amino acid transport system, ATPase component [Rhizobium leguminosarum bv. trifolii WSM597]MBB5662189.1 branched-chain amino acid transport system ATP-binding protein [Rhizobium leguminosarum]